MVNSDLLRTPLYSIYRESARLVPFSGWEMPVQFAGISREHQAVRQQVGMFDISHMGKFALQGTRVIDRLQKLVPSDLDRLQPGMAQYTVFLNPDGGIIDDLIIYHQGETAGAERIFIIANASTIAKNKTWLLQQFDEREFTDLSARKVLIAVQGRNSIATLAPLVEADLTAIPRFGHLEANLLGSPSFFARTGYTGEDGFEIMLDPDVGLELWRSLSTSGVTPCGLGARDTLRLEAAMALYGQDIDETTTPLEAGLGWLVHLESKGDFIGRSILEQQKQRGVSRRLVGLQMQGRNIARHDYPVLHEGKAIGKITSGTLSPTLNQAIALAYVPTEFSKVGQAIEVEIRGKAHPAIVVKKPFYRAEAAVSPMSK
ncbi:glycine cleavage system aminomethyltransferase GcvT [Microcoleus sp. FACHB-1515]|uniref:glycine cleavage system aminomethyltransferase GcvT n=1 Tax=Cyanophyceae TaxID=3028117 RepID=UPI0028C44DCE|nr:glycine cleavage system aminomethyltransferase GcvT [Microcoleus sp. FACHB-1515]